jgi:hypothetical protein
VKPPGAKSCLSEGVLRGVVIGCLLLLQRSRASFLSACSSAPDIEGSRYFDCEEIIENPFC